MKKKMQGLNNNLIGMSYCKKKEKIQEAYQEVTTQTNMKGQPMKKYEKKEVFQKIQML
jgi:hypothetical protein